MTVKVSDRQFIEAWRDSGGRAKVVADMLGLSERAAYGRRNSIEKAMGLHLPSAGDANGPGRGDAGAAANDYLQRVTIDGFEGRMIVFGDAHYWPGHLTLAHRALVEVVKETKPKLIIANGDVLDGARVSRFPRNGWEEQPRMADELEEVKERMAEIRHAARGARLIRTIGNHDIRFDRYLAVNASEMEGIAGARLSDHLPAWQECMSVHINGHTVVKHRIAGGAHAGYSNTLRAGTSTFTSHTHRLLTRPWGDYTGRRYGSECGTLAEVDGPQMSYAEGNPTDACSGFMTALFGKGGSLFYPVPCEVMNGQAVMSTEVVLRARAPRLAA